MDKILPEEIKLDGIDLVFEITRFCNMECPHCIRGKKQKLRIKKEYINAIMCQLNTINTITISGGEPTLAIDLMEYLLNSARHYEVETGNFFMATNGSNPTKRVLNNIMDWISFCYENDISGLRISMDDYHEWVDKRPWKDFEEEVEQEFGCQFYFDYIGAPDDPSYLICEGNAKENYYCTRKVSHKIELDCGGYVGNSIYVNAKGNLISTCDISYETEDTDSEFLICHCTEDIRAGLARFFNNHPEQVTQDFYESRERICI